MNNPSLSSFSPAITVILLLFYLSASLTAQTIDTTAQDTAETVQMDTAKPTAQRTFQKHPPWLAASLSVIPGLGQAYNKEFWKMPIIYAGLAGGGYLIYYTKSNFDAYHRQYRTKVDSTYSNPVSDLSHLSTRQVKNWRDQWQKWYHASIIGTSIWYVLNILDAYVGAHLYEFDVSDDLSMRVDPYLHNRYRTTGLTFTFSLQPPQTTPFPSESH